MKLFVGIFLIVISFLGTLFFRSYSGNMIAYPVFWHFFFIVLGILGAYLIYHSFKKTKEIIAKHHTEEFEKLKSNAEEIELNFDKCEFKSGSFSHQVEDPNMSTIKLFSPSLLANNAGTTVTENVVQSYLTYTDTINGEQSKFISQSFPFDPTTLKYHVLNNSITLYIDRFDTMKYFFYLKRESQGTRAAKTIE